MSSHPEMPRRPACGPAYLLLLTLAAAGACCATQEPAARPASEGPVAVGDPVAAAPSRILAAYNEGALEALSPWVSEQVLRTDTGPAVRGRGPYLDTIRALRTAFPDLLVAPVHTQRIGDTWDIKWRWSGTHQGSLAGWPPTGRRITHHGRTTYHFEDGLLVQVTVEADAAGLAAQLKGTTEP